MKNTTEFFKKNDDSALQNSNRLNENLRNQYSCVSDSGNSSGFSNDLQLCFLLIKNLDKSVSEEQLKSLVPESLKAQRVIFANNNNNVYLQFNDVRQVEEIIRKYSEVGLFVNGKRIEMGLVKKIPLDLNRVSAVVLCTFYSQKTTIDIQLIQELTLLMNG